MHAANPCLTDNTVHHAQMRVSLYAVLMIVLSMSATPTLAATARAKTTSSPTQKKTPKQPTPTAVKPETSPQPTREAPLETLTAAPPKQPVPPVESVGIEPTKTTRRLAVYELDAAGIDPRIARVLTDSVVAEVRKLQRTVVVGMDEIRAMLDLEASKQIMGCLDDSCLAEIAEALGVDGIIIGSVAIVGDGTTFGLKHIDQGTATTLGQSTRRIEGTDPANVLAAVGPVVAELFPDLPLKPGTTRGVPPQMALRIHPPPLSPVVFWSLLGSSGAAALVGGALTTLNAAIANDALADLDKSVGGKPADGARLNEQLATIRTTFIGTVAAYGTAVVLLGGAGVAAVFTDWDGLRGDDNE